MIVIQDADFDAAAGALQRACFRDAPWSYGSTVDPQSWQDTCLQEVHRLSALGYRNLDRNSRRLPFSPEIDEVHAERVVFLPSSYVHLSPATIPRSRFTRVDNFHYPDSELLLESFVRTCIKTGEADEGGGRTSFRRGPLRAYMVSSCLATMHWIRALMSKLRLGSMRTFGDTVAGWIG
ncbi:hypothetical protein B0H66DRAFT_393978 [Apodospora peruviana]|uniref:Uncharacterized protein n=1 Tax=Apodospora peruviana TaxID=516989 RepID=A0AAE0LY11_9PEZI|nr:hypothetical protein B0H66DRAFT_393978 [Apodospora peruviana]